MNQGITRSEEGEERADRAYSECHRDYAGQ